MSAEDRAELEWYRSLFLRMVIPDGAPPVGSEIKFARARIQVRVYDEHGTPGWASFAEAQRRHFA